jgi:hypothetical protein
MQFIKVRYLNNKDYMEQKFLCISGPFHDDLKTQKEAGSKYILYALSSHKPEYRTFILLYYCLAKKDDMWEVWATQGQREGKIAEFMSLKEAIKFCQNHKVEASFGIKLPSGDWYNWDPNK